MRPSLIRAMLALHTIPSTFAFNKLSVPSTIAANTDVNLQITNDLSSGSSSFDALFNTFRVYLSMSVPGWGSEPSCYLVNSSAIATTQLTFQIPASVGPDASSYSIATMEFNQNPYAGGHSGYEYSNDFAFTNGTGKWTAAELAGQKVADPNNVPCSAYNCARNCSQAFYPANVNNTNAYKSTYECTAACPGVTYVSWAELQAESGNGTSSAQNATTTSATASKATASTTGKSTASTSSTSPSHSASAGIQNFPAELTLLATVLVSILAVICI